MSHSAVILTLTLSRSFKSLNSGLRYGGLDPKSEVWPEAFGTWFGRFDYNGWRFPIRRPLPPFYIDRFLHIHIQCIFLHASTFYDCTVTTKQLWAQLATRSNSEHWFEDCAEQKVTKSQATKDQTIITLEGPDTYHAWFSYISGYIAEDLWTYVHPNSEETYKILKEVTFDMARASAISYRELTAVEKNIYIGLKAIHKTDVQQYQQYLTEIARLQSKILTRLATVDWPRSGPVLKF